MIIWFYGILQQYTINFDKLAVLFHRSLLKVGNDPVVEAFYGANAGEHNCCQLMYKKVVRDGPPKRFLLVIFSRIGKGLG